MQSAMDKLELKLKLSCKDGGDEIQMKIGWNYGQIKGTIQTLSLFLPLSLYMLDFMKNSSSLWLKCKSQTRDREKRCG